MTIPKINIGSVTPPQPAENTQSAGASAGIDGFAEALTRAGASVVQPQIAASQAIQQFARGADGNLHETLLAVDRAEISLKFLVSVRNRVVDAYREIMRMGM